jgi:hypothetical protein
LNYNNYPFSRDVPNDYIPGAHCHTFPIIALANSLGTPYVFNSYFLKTYPPLKLNIYLREQLSPDFERGKFMPNQWGHQPMGKDSWRLVLGIVIIGIIGYLLIPNFLKAEATIPATSLNNVNPSSTYDPNDPNSSGYPTQSLPTVTNALNNSNGNNELTAGYWILFLYDGTIQQLPVNAQDYAFVQGLVNSDTKGTSTNPVFLVESGQIQKYVVSNETYSIISNMATINRRSSNSLPNTNQAPSQTPTTPTPISPSPSSSTPTIPSTTPSTPAPSSPIPSTPTPSSPTPSTLTPSSPTPSTPTPSSPTPSTPTPSTLYPYNNPK